MPFRKRKQYNFYPVISGVWLFFTNLDVEDTLESLKVGLSLLEL